MSYYQLGIQLSPTGTGFFLNNYQDQGNLNLTSLQNQESYKEETSSHGTSISSTGGNISGSQGKINSNYNSVQEQTGIKAGEGGFEINVGGNTNLTGSVITSETNQNKLSTDTLTYSNLDNQAQYQASSTGASLGIGDNITIKPEVGVPASGQAQNSAQAGIAPGDIEVRSNPETDLSNLNRNPDQAFQALEQIFDKKTVQEKQELAKVFGEEAFKLVGDIAQKQTEKALGKYLIANSEEEKQKALQEVKNWQEGGIYRVALHTMVGGIMADLGGGDAASGAIGAGASEASRKVLTSLPEDLQRVGSAIIGQAAAEISGGNGETGAATAISGIENNHYGEGHKRVITAKDIDTDPKYKNLSKEQKDLLKKYLEADNILAKKMYFDLLVGATMAKKVMDMRNALVEVNMSSGGLTREQAELVTDSTLCSVIADSVSGVLKIGQQLFGQAGKAQWYKPDGNINYPPNGGRIIGTEINITLGKGEVLGRYGGVSPKSNYVTEAGANPSTLSLPPTTDPSKYQEFIVVKPIPGVIQSKVAAWGGDSGGGLQYELPMTIKELLRLGYIKEKI